MSARRPTALFPGFTAPDDADNAGAPHSGHDLVAAEAPELLRDRGRGPVHVVKQFRVGVDVTAPFRDFAMQVGDAIDDRHVLAFANCCPPPALAAMDRGCKDQTGFIEGCQHALRRSAAGVLL